MDFLNNWKRAGKLWRKLFGYSHKETNVKKKAKRKEEKIYKRNDGASFLQVV